MDWNPVLSMVIDIKHKYMQGYNTDNNPIFSYKNSFGDKFTNTIEYWVYKLSFIDRSFYNYASHMIRPLLINQYNNFVLIKYNSLDMDWDAQNGFYRECRSVVLDLQNECVVLTPFRKFFNVGEREETQFDVIQNKIAHAKSIEISDKLDGSMVSARWYNDSLVVSGSQAIDPANSWRLQNYYKWFFEHQDYVNMIKAGKNYTYIFEAIFPEDPHVVQYDDSMIGLHLIGIRSVRHGNEFSYARVKEIAEEYNVRSVCPLRITFEQMFNQCRQGDVPSNEAEGYVISIDGEKFKCKHNNYVLMHHAISKILSPNAIMDSIREDRFDDFISMIPTAYRPQADVVAKNIFAYMKIINANVEHWYRSIPGNILDNRKESMVWMGSNVPKLYLGKVRSRYLGQDIDYLKGIKYSDIEKYLTTV